MKRRRNMNKKVSIKKAVQYVVNAEKDKCTLLGIGPMSENFLRASLEISKEKDFPLMYIASRNQVDAYKFGGGYVFNSDQKLFREKIEKICKEIDYDNVYYLCRDHGGPWQRDKETIICRKMWQLSMKTQNCRSQSCADITHIPSRK
jgi:D-tagatose-1,6-bisphosphate aldolase subunit GatZ/KbaZ